MHTRGESRESPAVWQSRRFLIPTILLAGTLAPGTRPVHLSAQQIPSAYRFIETAQEAGAAMFTVEPRAGIFGFGPKGGRIMGSYYQVRVGGPFSIQGNLGYLPTTRDVIDPRRDEGDRKIGEADVTMGTADVRLQFTLTGPRTWYRLAPHLFAGGGIALDLAPDQDIDMVLEEDDRFSFGPSFLGSFGAGIKLFPVDRISVRAEGIVTYWKVNTPRGFLRTDRRLLPPPEGSDEPAIPDDGFWAVGRGLSVGIAWRF